MLLPVELSMLTIKDFVSHAFTQEVWMLTRMHCDSQGGGDSQLFRSTALSQQNIGEPGSWCIAQIER